MLDESSEDEESPLSTCIPSPVKDTCTPKIEYGPHRKFSRKDEAYKLEKEYKMVTERKFVCSLNLLLDVFTSCCQTPGCCNAPNVSHHFIGTTLIINCSCQSGHLHRFCSSHEVNDMYVNNIQAAAAVILSGNNYGKINRLAEFMNLAFPSKSSFFRIQRLYLIPAVDEWWNWMHNQLVQEFLNTDMVVAGDGQCDSPGFNAKNICYFITEVNSNYIVHIEVLDKRHVGLISTNMEREAVKRSVEKLKEENLKIVELVTDASSSIKKLLGWYHLDSVLEKIQK